MQKLTINIFTTKNSWMNPFDEKLKECLENRGHIVHCISSKTELHDADISLLLSCLEILEPEYLEKSKHNLVVHASDLPHGKGWSPATWQIIEGKNNIPLTLFEATQQVDSGPVYITDNIQLDGAELIDDWQKLMGNKIVDICLQFVDNYPQIISNGHKQSGNETFYPRRRPQDSELDINKTIAEQFNLLRVVDNEKYPAFFIKDGKKYIIQISKDKNE